MLFILGKKGLLLWKYRVSFLFLLASINEIIAINKTYLLKRKLLHFSFKKTETCSCINLRTLA